MDADVAFWILLDEDALSRSQKMDADVLIIMLGTNDVFVDWD
jgi:lysophospholipase L1-like esterase